MTDERRFTTDSTPLAAWLQSQGFSFLSVDTQDYPAKIIFENSDALQKAKRQWEMGQAKGNCCLFYDNYRMLLDKIKPSWVWRGQRPPR